MAKLAAAFEYSDAELLALYREAYATIAVKGQEYQFGQRRLTRADLAEVQQQIDWLENRIAAASSGLTIIPVRRTRD